MPQNASSADQGTAAVPRAVLLYSHSWLSGQIDGVAVRMMAHAQALATLGTRVTVVTPDFVLKGEAGAFQAKPQLVSIPGVEHYVVETQRTPVYRKNLCMKLSLGNLVTLVQLIRRTKPDIVHGTQEASMHLLATACLLCGVPLVVSMHTDVGQIAVRDQGFSTLGGSIGRLHASVAVYFTKMGYRNWANAGATYFAVSQQSKDILQDAGVARARVSQDAWGPMVDRQQFRIDLPAERVRATREDLSFGIKDAFVMSYCGRVTAEKDIQFLVDALKRAPSNVVLAMIGPGSMCAELSKLHGKEHRIHCTGAMLGREEVALALRASDCCVSASTMETVGFTAMEAISCGTPMLAANAQGFALHLSHGVNSRLFTPLDEGSFDGELATLMTTPLEGAWSRESLRASMDMASVEVCTERALRSYAGVPATNYWYVRTFFALVMLFINWMVAFIIK